MLRRSRAKGPDVAACRDAIRPERILDRLAAWKQAARNRHVGTMVLKGASAEVTRVVVEAVL